MLEGVPEGCRRILKEADLRKGAAFVEAVGARGPRRVLGDVGDDQVDDDGVFAGAVVNPAHIPIPQLLWGVEWGDLASVGAPAAAAAGAVALQRQIRRARDAVDPGATGAEILSAGVAAKVVDDLSAAAEVEVHALRVLGRVRALELCRHRATMVIRFFRESRGLGSV